MNRKKSRTFLKNGRPGKNLGRIDPGHILFKPSVTDFTLDGSAYCSLKQFGGSSGLEISGHIGRMDNSKLHNIFSFVFSLL
jgi:hypothetical protein